MPLDRKGSAPTLDLGQGRGPDSWRKRLYSVQEAATYLALSVDTIRGLVWDGTLPSVRLGSGTERKGRVLIDRVDLDRLIDTGKRRRADLG